MGKKLESRNVFEPAGAQLKTQWLWIKKMGPQRPPPGVIVLFD